MELKTAHRDQPHSGRTIIQIVREELAHRAVLVMGLGIAFAVAAVVAKTTGAERIVALLNWFFGP